jgi:hypothetical protein
MNPGREVSIPEVRRLDDHISRLREFAEARAAGEYEDLPPHHELMHEIVGWQRFTFEHTVNFLRSRWPLFKPYTRYSNCDPIHKMALEIIDPDFVKQSLEAEAERELLASEI